MHEKKPSSLPPGYDRLERVIAHMGLASRREAKALITSGEVKVNGKKVLNPGHGVLEGKDVIVIQSKTHQDKQSVLVYKKRGIETNKTLRNSLDLHDQFKEFKHLHPIGRLDKESEGLIIMSNDGTLAKALTKENSDIGKTYLVFVREQISDNALLRMSEGVTIDGIMTKPARVKRMGDKKFTIELHEGRKHQIRRMCEIFRLTIEKLERIKIGHLDLKYLKSGQSAAISQKDIERLKGH